MFSALAIAITTSRRDWQHLGRTARSNIRVSIAVAIAIHNIPEGIAVSVPIYYATGSRRKAFAIRFIGPVGATRCDSRVLTLAELPQRCHVWHYIRPCGRNYGLHLPRRTAAHGRSTASTMWHLRLSGRHGSHGPQFVVVVLKKPRRVPRLSPVPLPHSPEITPVVQPKY